MALIIGEPRLRRWVPERDVIDGRTIHHPLAGKNGPRGGRDLSSLTAAYHKAIHSPLAATSFKLQG